MSQPQAASVLRAYRTVLKSCYKCFGEDRKALYAAIRFARQKFVENKGDASQTSIEKKIKDAVSAAEVLDKLIVQGVQQPTGSIELKIRPTTHLEKNPPIKCKSSGSASAPPSKPSPQ